MRHISLRFLLTIGLVLAPPAVLPAQGPPGGPPGGPPAGVPGAPATATVQVDCARGGSINAALSNPATNLTVEITGVCDEDVVIRRDHVRLVGTTGPAVDGIRATDATNEVGAAVLVRDAEDVSIENLTLGNAVFVGLFARDALFLNVLNCRLEGNGLRGANVLGGTFGLIEDTVIRGNGTAADPAALGAGRGIQVSSGAGITLRRCTVTENGPPGTDLGLYVLRGAQVTVQESTISGWIAVATDAGGQITVSDSTVTGVLNPPGGSTEGFGYAVYADTNSRIAVVRTTVANGLVVDNQSQLVLRRVTQTVNDSPDQNWAMHHSLLEAANSSTLAGATQFSSFSKGDFRGATSLGDLSCEPGSDALCIGPVSRTGSDCALCPCADEDGDGFFAQEGCGPAPDCDDGDPAVNPAAAEVCGDGADNNCSGTADEGCP